jgi:hypothetical protein
VSYDQIYAKLIFRVGTGICGLCKKDRQDIVYLILNRCHKMVGDHTSRHNLIIDRLAEAIKANCHIIGDIHQIHRPKSQKPKERMTNHFTQVLDQTFSIGRTKLLKDLKPGD